MEMNLMKGVSLRAKLIGATVAKQIKALMQDSVNKVQDGMQIVRNRQPERHSRC